MFRRERKLKLFSLYWKIRLYISVEVSFENKDCYSQIRNIGS